MATPRARFAQPEIKLGAFPPLAAAILPYIIGPKQALELVLTGETISAERAREMGLVNRLVPEDQLENRIKNLQKLADSVQAALGRQSFSGKHQALSLANDLRLKIAANWKMFQVAKLLREPARESMLSRVSSSVTELEEAIASHFGVEMT